MDPAALLPTPSGASQPLPGCSAWHDSRSPTSAAARPAAPARWPASSSTAENFAGSEIVLIDLDADRLELVRRLAERMAREPRRRPRPSPRPPTAAPAWTRCDAVLSSYRPGGFEARVLDERIPLAHGVIGQETQGPGGFFMALRSIHVLQGILDDMARPAPTARIFNYTNPVNIVAQAVTRPHRRPVRVALRGADHLPGGDRGEPAGLDPARVEVASVGLNHGSWSVRHTLRRGGPAARCCARRGSGGRDDPELRRRRRRLLRLAAAMGAGPGGVLPVLLLRATRCWRELTAKPTTRAEDILGWVPGYWAHYEEQARAATSRSSIPPARAAASTSSSWPSTAWTPCFNDRGEVLPVNVPNRGLASRASRTTLVVETLGRCDAAGVRPLPRCRACPRTCAGWWRRWPSTSRPRPTPPGRARRATRVRALAAHPLVRSLELAEHALRGDGRRRTARTCRSGSCPRDRLDPTRPPARDRLASARAAATGCSGGDRRRRAERPGRRQARARGGLRHDRVRGERRPRRPVGRDGRPQRHLAGHAHEHEPGDDGVLGLPGDRPGYALHPAAEQVHAYLRAYADALRRHAADPVRHAGERVGPGWKVDGEPFDAVVVASGRFRRPRLAAGLDALRRRAACTPSTTRAPSRSATSACSSTATASAGWRSRPTSRPSRPWCPPSASRAT